MKKIKGLLIVLIAVLTMLSCSIDSIDLIPTQSMDTEYVPVGDEIHPWGGYWVYFYADGVLYNQIFLSNGADGKDGINGIDGIDGVDGVSVTIATEEAEGGYWLHITTGDETESVFISNGIDGIDGEDGEDGTSAMIHTEEGENGYWLIITTIEGTTRIFISNGVDGINGLDGVDGIDGVSTTVITEEAENGYWLIILENGVETTRVLIENGTDGTNGLDGLNGVDGINGTDGTNGIDGVSVTVFTEEAQGGYWLIILHDGVETTRTFIADGADGTNGLDGIDGTDGEDGISATILTQETEGGYWLIILENGIEVSRVFVANGVDGLDGINGLDGIDGVDGVSAEVRTEEAEGGYWLIILQDGVEVSRVFVADGIDGTNGLDGIDGTDGENGSGNTVTICHKVTHPVAEHPEWGNNTYVTLTYNFPEYIQHIYEYHIGNSSQNDAFGECN